MKVSNWFVALVALFVACLIASNIIAVKLVVIFGFVLPAAIIIFPLSYILGDVLTEVYGYARARRVIWLGFPCNLIAGPPSGAPAPCRRPISGTARTRTGRSSARRRAFCWARSSPTSWANSPTPTSWPR